MDFQTQYDTLTKKIDDTLTTQVSSSLTWDNIPGNFSKVVSSSGGYAWGVDMDFGKPVLYSCELPCTGKWVKADLKDYNTYNVADIAVDSTNVYILVVKESGTKLNVNILMNIPSGKGEWTNIYSGTSTAAFLNIFSTKNFLWLTEFGSDVIKKCSKPCTSSNWMNQPNTQGITITSTTDTDIYGVDRSGKPVKTDENMRTGWNIIKGLLNNSNLAEARIVGADPQRTGIYAISNQGKLFNCKGNCENPTDVVPVDNKDLNTFNLSYDSGSKNLWMTTWNPGEKGNVFTQVDNPDYNAILNTVNPLDKQRDEITKDVKKEYEQQTKTLITNKQIQTVVDFFSKQFGYTKTVGEQTKDQTSAVTQNIQSTQDEIDKKSMISDKLFKIIVTLVIVVFIYLIGETLIGIYIHLIAALVLTGGIIFTIYY